MEKSVFKCKIEPRHVDFTDRVSLSSMCDIVLHVAGEDARSRGFGIDALAGNNFGWVLSRMCIELDYLPEEYIEFTVYTWISDYNRLSSTRNFTLVDDQEREFGRLVSQWCMIDYNTRMPPYASSQVRPPPRQCDGDARRERERRPYYPRAPWP